MARLARCTIPGFPHHLVQRGHHDQPVFESEADYRRYLDWLHEYTSRYGVDIWAYCLMPNHVHFICVPNQEDALARAFNSLHMRYAQYFNGKRHDHGPLWRPRFMSASSMNRRPRGGAIRREQSRPGLAGLAEDYAWSSARCHTLGEPDPVLIARSDSVHALNKMAGVPMARDIPGWRSYLTAGGDEAIVKRTRERLKTGRPAGDAEFVRVLEGIVGRRLGALPIGRPRKGGTTIKSS